MSEETEADKPTQVQLRMPEEVAGGAYCNVAMVSHNETEFTMDFGYIQPQQPVGTVRARIITNPKHMKLLLAVFQTQVEQYENKFGLIDMPKTPHGVTIQ